MKGFVRWWYGGIGNRGLIHSHSGSVNLLLLRTEESIHWGEWELVAACDVKDWLEGDFEW